MTSEHLKWFESEVFAFVSGELVRAGEAPAAVRPGAGERLLARVRPGVRLVKGGFLL